MHHLPLLRRALLGAALLATLPACDDAPTASDDRRAASAFIVDVDGTRFTVLAADTTAVGALRARMASGERGVILGRIARGDGGFNAPWSWHLDPATVEAPDMATEVCDGQPSYVQQHVDEFVDVVRYYCPWGARVVAEVR